MGVAVRSSHLQCQESATFNGDCILAERMSINTSRNDQRQRLGQIDWRPCRANDVEMEKEMAQAAEISKSATPADALFTPEQLRNGLSSSAFAYRGYNVTNLGLTPELMDVPAYRSIMEPYLIRAANVCSDVKGRKVDLLRRIEEREETTLATYDEAVSMIVAVEVAHVAILRELFGVDIASAKVAYGFSLGEISALVASGVIELEDALRIPIAMSDDCVDLANDVTLGVLFSRRGELSVKKVSQLCQEINAEGKGVIGVSAWLAPNSCLVIAQRETLDKLQKRKTELLSLIHI